VVALLGATELVASGDHRRALREQQRGEQVALLALAQLHDRGIVRRPFVAMVPGQVVRMAVAIAFGVGLVVLVVVADEVVQGETVVRGDEVDARPGLAAALVEEVRRTRHPARERARRAVVALPEGAGGVPEAIVPFGPAGQGLSDLVAARPAVPRLR